MSKITFELSTDDRYEAIHMLDCAVKTFNHWYGGYIEYKLVETSFEGKPIKKEEEK